MMGSDKLQLRRRIFYAALLLLYLGFHLFVILNHEAFRDEAQAWTIAKNTTLSELFADLSIEGHPCLWFLIIRPFAKLGMSFRYFSYVSLVFMGVAAALFLFRAPFGEVLKVIVLGSFAFCYNSPVMPRTYCVITLLIVCLAILWPKRLEKPVLYGILIGLLFQSHIILAGFAGGLVLELFIQWIRKKPRINRLFWGMAIPTASALFTVYELMPRKDAPVFVDTSAQSILGKMSLSYNQFIAAVNDLEETVFGHLVCELQIGPVTGKAVILLILLLLFLALLLAVTAKREWGSFWSVALIGICGLGFSLGLRLFVYRGGYHMTVCYFLILLFLVWISYSSVQAKSVKAAAGILLAFTLLLTCEKWINAVKFDLTEAFSGSRPTADFIDATVEENGTRERTISFTSGALFIRHLTFGRCRTTCRSSSRMPRQFIISPLPMQDVRRCWKSFTAWTAGIRWKRTTGSIEFPTQRHRQQEKKSDEENYHHRRRTGRAHGSV